MFTAPDTIKLFDQDAYAADFSAAVLTAERTVKQEKKGKKGKKEIVTWQLVLDRTLFFPEEGGQTPDTGTIEGFPVIDVQLEGSVIRHTVLDNRTEEAVKEDGENPLFSPGQTIRGVIDFAHRFSNMQNHSGEHILSGLVHGRFGYDNVGFHLSDNTVTLDFNGPLTDEDILWLEQAANRVVWDNREIRGWYPDPEELRNLSYRSKKEIDGPLRLVEIPGVDMCKAAEDVSHLTNMPREEIAAGTSRILEDNDRLRQREARLEDLLTRSMSAAVPAGQRDVFLFADGIGNLAQRRLVNTLCGTHDGYCGVFIGTDETGYRYIIGAADEKDARVLNACLNKTCGARGGGSPAMVQGSLKCPEDEIRRALEDALTH